MSTSACLYIEVNKNHRTTLSQNKASLSDNVCSSQSEKLIIFYLNFPTAPQAKKLIFHAHGSSFSLYTYNSAAVRNRTDCMCQKSIQHIHRPKNNMQHLKIMRTAIIQTDSLVPNNYHKASFTNSYFLRWQASGYTEGCSIFLSSMKISFEPMSPLQNGIHLTEVNKKMLCLSIMVKFLHSKMLTMFK